ncbi:MAG: hypothetical protein Q8S84_02960 [bacterium]|nr:hypothetical protein [bacterium]
MNSSNNAIISDFLSKPLLFINSNNFSISLIIFLLLSHIIISHQAFTFVKPENNFFDSFSSIFKSLFKNCLIFNNNLVNSSLHLSCHFF